MTKAKACKGGSQEWSLGVTFHASENVGECEGMNLHIPKWAPTLGIQVPIDYWILRGWLQGWKLIWLNNSLYHWKSLRTYMSKMGLYDPFEYLKHKLWQKERPKWQFDSRPLKVKNCLNLVAWRWCATYRWKVFDEGYNFALDLTSIKGPHKKLWASKVVGVLILGMSGPPTSGSQNKITFGCRSHVINAHIPNNFYSIQW